jgi:hypothetical protein
MINENSHSVPLGKKMIQPESPREKTGCAYLGFNPRLCDDPWVCDTCATMPEASGCNLKARVQLLHRMSLTSLTLPAGVARQLV